MVGARKAAKVMTSTTTIASVTSRIQRGAMSCSVRWRASPCGRRLPNERLTPCTTGPISVPSVHTAATAITPAPMKRTCVRQTSAPKAASALPSGIGVMAVRYGTAMPQAITKPTSMANPPIRPIR